MSDLSTTRQKVAAELIGTFALVFLGTTTAVFTGADVVATALAFGLALLLGVHAFGRISGAHLNPAVSVGAAISGRMSWGQVPTYVGAQLVGAIGASATLWVLLRASPDSIRPTDQLGQNAFGGPDGIAWWGALLVEVVATAVLVGVIMATTDPRNEHPAIAPLVIGLTLAAVHLAVIPMTGTSVNPARSIGPALFTGSESLKDLWVFVVAPLVGGALAGLAYPALFGRGSDAVPGSGLALGRRPVAAAPGYGAPDQLQQEWNQPEDLTAYADPAAPGGYAEQVAQAGYDAQTGGPGEAQVGAAYEPEVIIQDGWQWDHQAQEWKPLEQWAPGADPVEPIEPTEPTEPTGTGSTPLEPDPDDTPDRPRD